MRYIPLLLSVNLACASTALAGIYGTSPVANSVWTAGRSESVTWTDDKSQPKLSKLGKIDVQLYSGTDTLVATLAEDVDADSKSVSTWISPSWGHDGSDYYIMFSGKKLPVPVFTASFTIVGMANVSANGDNTTAPFKGSNGPKQDSLAPTTPNTTAGISRTGTATLLPHTTPSSSYPQPSASSTIPPISAEEEEDFLRHHRGPHSSAGSAILCVDYERLKFRLVFIIWPAVIGITMAL
ncbi:hypothetical protein BC835DRAFT_1328467 [Cytidiella melzeri]|nr:hypothetical protein BC835DRAFT_1328467 [Cytidiella melzeri]